MRWRAPPPVFPVPRRTWTAFDIVASLFLLAVAAHAAALLARGVQAGYERLAIVWLCGQLGAVGLAAYFWVDRSEGAKQALHAAAIADLAALAAGLFFPSVVSWAARVLYTDPRAYL